MFISDQLTAGYTFHVRKVPNPTEGQPCLAALVSCSPKKTPGVPLVCTVAETVALLVLAEKIPELSVTVSVAPVVGLIEDAAWWPLPWVRTFWVVAEVSPKLSVTLSFTVYDAAVV